MAGALWLPHCNPSFQRLSGLARMCLSRGWDVACCPEPDSVRSYGLLLAGFMFSEAVPYPGVLWGSGGKRGGDSVLLLGQSGRKVEAGKRRIPL